MKTTQKSQEDWRQTHDCGVYNNQVQATAQAKHNGRGRRLDHGALMTSFAGKQSVTF